MARYTGPVCRFCRREGLKLFLKGDRCYTDKCSVGKRNYAPGQHGASKKKISNYGIQLREKQKTKRIYGVLESQFRGYYERAERQKGKAGENLLILLETRLDNVVFRLGYGDSRTEARQLVTHGHFLVNGRRVDIASFKVRPGDVVEVCSKSKSSDRFKSFADNPKTAPKWLESDFENFKGKILSNPQREDIDIPVNETLIIELYSK